MQCGNYPGFTEGGVRPPSSCIQPLYVVIYVELGAAEPLVLLT